MRLIFAALVALTTTSCEPPPTPRVLVFSKTEAYRHESIPSAHRLIRQLGESNGFAVDSTEDGSTFTEESLSGYDVVVFALTTGDVLDEAQQAAFESYIRSGGSYVGIHSASDTEYGWPWYGRLVGGYFDGHPGNPNVRNGTLHVDDGYHVSTQHLPQRWPRTDEWYDIRDFDPSVDVLITIDEATYRDSVREEAHPLAWYHSFEGGRSFYSALGHTSETYSEPLFQKFLLGGIEYALGRGDRVERPPDESGFVKEVLLDTLNEPVEIDQLPDGRIIYNQRRGEVLIVDTESFAADTAAVLEVDSSAEDGLLGLAVDPNFDVNNWIYVFYSRVEAPEQSVSRFKLSENRLDLSTEQVVLTIPLERGCCHSGGSLEFDRHGNLFISVGDNTNPFASDGRSPIDELPGREHWNAQRSASNTQDLRGKILRIHPEEDGTYSIPDGNLFPRDGSGGRPEIYVMGDRNPFRIAVDPKTDFLYWGEVGPDAQEDDSVRGPRGYDEINQARAAGNFGWPYFIADNKPYAKFDFATGKTGGWFDPSAPVNTSRLNTGARELPPAQPAMIWYPYNASPDFPITDGIGRTAMAGPVYYSDGFANAPHRFPDFYNGHLFIYEWMRSWIMTVSFAENGDMLRIEEFVPSMELSRPMDMIFAEDGSLYILEYGTKWAAPNPDARLSRIRYTPPEDR